MIKNDRANYMTIARQQTTNREQYLLERELARGAVDLKEREYVTLQPQPDRFFIDTLTATGEHFLIPSSRRAEWNAFDAQSEETAEMLPVPDWARPVAEMSHLEFEMPEEISK